MGAQQWASGRGCAPNVGGGCYSPTPWTPRTDTVQEVREFARLATEQRNPRTNDLDTLERRAGAADDLGRGPTPCLRRSRTRFRWIAKARGTGGGVVPRGRPVIYVGAGRAAGWRVLDAVRVPAHVRIAPEMVQGVMAGGHSALCARRRGRRGPRGRRRPGMVERRWGRATRCIGLGRQPAHRRSWCGARQGARDSGRDRVRHRARRARSSSSTWTWRYCPKWARGSDGSRRA
jgi:hypothetical protein